MTAVKRLMQEYRDLLRNPTDGVVAGPIDEDNVHEWEALIAGPSGTEFEGGAFTARLSFPKDYPLNPPKMRFTTPLFHPNIYANGNVCISILHAPTQARDDDPTTYFTSAERWSPVQTTEKILLSVVSMLAEPNDESPANIEAAKCWRNDRERYKQLVHECVKKSIGF